jgi:hypothetical protein
MLILYVVWEVKTEMLKKIQKFKNPKKVKKKFKKIKET